MRREPIGQCHNVNGINCDEFSGSTTAVYRQHLCIILLHLEIFQLTGDKGVIVFMNTMDSS